MFNNLKLKVMKKFISTLVKENKLNLKIYRDFMCSNKKVYKENYFSFIDFIMSSNDKLQIRQLYKFINKLADNRDMEYITYFHQKYLNKFMYMFIDRDRDKLKYYINMD